MADAFIELQNNPQAAEMPHADWLGFLMDREVTFRYNRRLACRLPAALDNERCRGTPIRACLFGRPGRRLRVRSCTARSNSYL